MTQYGFVFDADACANCKACMAACKDVHDMPAGYKLRRVMTAEAGEWQANGSAWSPQGVFSYSVSVACNHCDNPACMAACDQGAVSKNPESGIVTIDEGVCIGCGSCAKACPYGAPVVLPDAGHASKCDLCAARLANGDGPACVAACMTRCLNYGDIAELRATYGDNADNALLPSSDLTRPNIVILPHRNDTGLTSVDIVLANAPEEFENA